MATVMANVRLDKNLKENGDAVLRQEGATFTKAVTELYEFLANEQRLPEFMTRDNKDSDLIAARRKNAQAFSGCLRNASAITDDEIKIARLARQ